MLSYTLMDGTRVQINCGIGHTSILAFSRGRGCIEFSQDIFFYLWHCDSKCTSCNRGFYWLEDTLKSWIGIYRMSLLEKLNTCYLNLALVQVKFALQSQTTLEVCIPRQGEALFFGFCLFSWHTFARGTQGLWNKNLQANAALLLNCNKLLMDHKIFDRKFVLTGVHEDFVCIRNSQTSIWLYEVDVYLEFLFCRL